MRTGAPSTHRHRRLICRPHPSCHQLAGSGPRCRSIRQPIAAPSPARPVGRRSIHGRPLQFTDTTTRQQREDGQRRMPTFQPPCDSVRLSIFRRVSGARTVYLLSIRLNINAFLHQCTGSDLTLIKFIPVRPGLQSDVISVVSGVPLRRGDHCREVRLPDGYRTGRDADRRTQPSRDAPLDIPIGTAGITEFRARCTRSPAPAVP